MKTIGLASDHAGFELKQYVKQWLDARGWSYKDFGTYTAESCDYPDFAHPLALAVEAGECYPGIAICGAQRRQRARHARPLHHLRGSRPYHDRVLRHRL